MIYRIIIAVDNAKSFADVDSLTAEEKTFFQDSEAHWPPVIFPTTRDFDVGFGIEKLIDVQGNDNLRYGTLPAGWRLVNGATLNGGIWETWSALLDAEYMNFMNELDDSGVRIVPTVAKDLHQFWGEPKRF